jgi:O-antigen ligase
MSNTAGLGSFGELFRSLRRLGWLIVAGSVLGVAATTLFASGAHNVSATARIGLTSEVQWPFLNAARQRVAGLADSVKPADVLGGEVGAGTVVVDVSLPNDETFIEVRATATDVDTAIRAADAYAAMLVALDSAVPLANTQIQTSLDHVKEQITFLESRVKAADEASIALLEEQANADVQLALQRNRRSAQAALAAAKLNLSIADAAVQTAAADRERLVRRLTSLQAERDRLDLEIQSEPRRPEVELIGSAGAQEIPGSPLGIRQLLGGLIGAVVLGLLAWVLDRSFGIIRTPAALRSATELPVVDARRERGAGRLAIWMDRLSEAQTIGFIGDQARLQEFLEQLQALLLDPATIARPAQAVRQVESGLHDMRLLVALGEPSDGHGFDRGVGICDEIVLVVPAGEKRPAELQQLIRDVTALGSKVSLVVLAPAPGRIPSLGPSARPGGQSRPIADRRLETVASLQIAGAVWCDVYRWDTLAFTEILRWPVSAAVWLAPFLWLLRSPDTFGAVRRLPMASLTLWSVWYLVAVNWSNDFPPALGFSLGVLSTTLAASFFVGTFGWEKLARVVAITIAVFAVAGVFYRAVNGDFFGDHGRFYGIGIGPTATGGHAVVLALTGIAGFRGQRRFQVVFVALGMFVAGVAVAKTAMIGLSVGLLYVAYWAMGRTGRLRILMMVTGLVGGAGVFATIIGGKPTDPAAGPLSTSSALTVTGRTEVWAATKDFILQRPIAGWGTGSSTILYGHLIGDGWLHWHVTTAHNLWLQSLLEHGLIGCGLLIATTVTLFIGCRRRPLPARDAILIWLLLNSLTEPLVQYPGLPLVLIAGVAGMLTYPRPRDISVIFADRLDERVAVGVQEATLHATI